MTTAASPRIQSNFPVGLSVSWRGKKSKERAFNVEYGVCEKRAGESGKDNARERKLDSERARSEGGYDGVATRRSESRRASNEWGRKASDPDTFESKANTGCSGSSVESSDGVTLRGTIPAPEDGRSEKRVILSPSGWTLHKRVKLGQ